MLCHILPPLLSVFRCFFDATATADFYTLSLHDALPICPFEPLLLPLEPSLAGPRALQVVADVQAQPAQSLRLQFDQIPVLERAQPAVVGARGKDNPGLQSVNGADPLDAPRNLVRHVARVEVLLERF